MIYRLALTSAELVTRDAAAAEAIMAALVHCGPTGVSVLTLSEEENGYYERFQGVDWNEKGAFSYDWRKWMEEMKRGG